MILNDSGTFVEGTHSHEYRGEHLSTRPSLLLIGWKKYIDTKSKKDQIEIAAWCRHW
jgi:hypothetical protein